MTLKIPFRASVKREEFIELKNAICKINGVLAEHLDTINQNTNEIQGNYEYLCRLEAKIDSLKEQIEALMLRLNEISPGEKEHNKIELSYEEKKIFLVIYKYSSSERFVSYTDIAKRLSLPLSLIRSYITNLIEKGVPIIKKYQNREIFVSLDNAFREAQAKENLVNINESITRYI